MLDTKLLDRLVKPRRGMKSTPVAEVLDDSSEPPKSPSTDVRKTPLRADVFAIIIRSGLFEPEYYRMTNPSIEGTERDLLEHFLDSGCDSNRRPNPYFEPADVSTSGMQPLLHYILHGDMEDRWPGPLFNTPWYRNVHSVPRDKVALAHYLAERRRGTVSPLPEFDISFYARNNPDVISAQIDPFEHFVSYGFREGRNPSAEFDVRWYANEYLSGSLSENPFYHWLSHKGKPGVYGRFPISRRQIDSSKRSQALYASGARI
jgi:hypothetical protein